MDRKIILASTSPRRREILEKMGLEFEIIPSNYEEKLESDDFTYKQIEALAYNKVLAVASDQKSISFVIGADTVVVLNNKILGKPKNEKDAEEMLLSLSDTKHIVVTSICVIKTPEMTKSLKSTTSEVIFENLKSKTIQDYIVKFKPFDKAGSYGIQELPFDFKYQIKGCFENIMGISSQELEKMLR